MSAFQTYFVDTIKNRYADFSGRASRSEYWYFTLFSTLIYMVFYIPLMMSVTSSLNSGTVPGSGFNILGIIFMVLALALLVPSLALLVRRLHDVNRSGWYYFIALIPLIGSIILLVWLVTESQPGTNKWGPNPWGVGVENAADHLVIE